VEIHDTTEVAFVMVKNNDTNLQQKLDGVRKNRHKFICLNDNLFHDDPNTPLVKQMMHDFYSALLPLPSPFEKQEMGVRASWLLFWLGLIITMMLLCLYVSVMARRNGIRKID
jgi:hypothetical protein